MDPDNEERQLVAEEPPLEAPLVPVSAGATAQERCVPALTPKNKQDLALFFCNHCKDYVRGGVITTCGHLFCWTCLWPLVADIPHPDCPLCETKLSLIKDIVPFPGHGPNARPGDNHILAEPGAVPRPSEMCFPVHHEAFGGNVRNMEIFICNRCSYYVRGGVVSICGHLFCWTCLWPLLANDPNAKCPRCRCPLVLEEDIFPLNARPGEDPILAEPGAMPRPLGFAGNDEDDVADQDDQDQFGVVNPAAQIAMRMESTYFRWLQYICGVLMILFHTIVTMA